MLSKKSTCQAADRSGSSMIALSARLQGSRKLKGKVDRDAGEYIAMKSAGGPAVPCKHAYNNW
jgi:hypothetical protein